MLKKINIMMGVTADDIEVTVDVCNDKQNTKANEQNMKKDYVKLIESANYLIQLFFVTGRRYSCTRTKIGKLLTIVAFKYASEGIQIFEETIYQYDDCGTAIREIMDHFDKNIYMQYIDFDDSQYIACEFDWDLAENDYNDYSTIETSVKWKIEEVFRMFGAYSSSRLGKCINSIISQNDMVTINEEIDLKKICVIKNSNLQFDRDVDKSLINYLFN